MYSANYRFDMLMLYRSSVRVCFNEKVKSYVGGSVAARGGLSPGTRQGCRATTHPPSTYLAILIIRRYPCYHPTSRLQSKATAHNPSNEGDSRNQNRPSWGLHDRVPPCLRKINSGQVDVRRLGQGTSRRVRDRY